MKKCDIAKKFGIKKQTLRNDKKNSEKIKAVYFRPNDTFRAYRTVIFVYGLSVLNNTMTKYIGSVLSGSCE